MKKRKLFSMHKKAIGKKKSANNSGFMRQDFLKVQIMVTFCNCLLDFRGIKNSSSFTDTPSFTRQCM